MYPDLFGIKDFSYIFMIIIGVIAASVLLIIYLNKKGLKEKSFLDLLVVVIGTVLVGVIFAMLFENVYEAIKHAINGTKQEWTWGMTFYGGLIAGVPTFLLLYKFYYLRHNEPILKHILVIAPASISLGHAFGRVGCFLAGCCYGIETEPGQGVLFPGHTHEVVPTQLIEAIYLFILAGALIALAFKKDFAYNFVIYMGFYGVFRFIIEFFRGDERGQLAGLSPSQYVCILMVIGCFFVYSLFKKKIFVEKENHNEI